MTAAGDIWRPIRRTQFVVRGATDREYVQPSTAAMANDTHRFRAALERSTALRYALAPLCIAVALLVQLAVTGPFPMWSQAPPLIHPTGLFQICVVAAAWFGGAGPGLLAALLATLILPQVIAMNYPLIAAFLDLPRFLAFAIT